MVYGPNEFVVEGGVAKIVVPVSGGEVVYSPVDAEDANRVVSYGRWYQSKRGCVSFGSELTGPRTSLHSFIMGATRHQKVVHKNGDLYDNRKSNLVIKGVNDAVVENGVARVEVTRSDGSTRDWFLVDEEYLDRVRQVGRWHLTTLGYINCHQRGGKAIVLHRFLLDAPKGEYVDHVNGDGKDNRKCNLRIVSQSENMQNRFADKGRPSSAKNACWAKHANMWRVGLVVDGKRVEGGYFKDFDEAVQAAAKLRCEHHTHCPEKSGR